MRNIFYLFFLVSNLIYSQHTFDVNSQSVDINTNFSIDIGLDNSVEVTAFQFDLDYDGDAFDLLTGHTLTSRAENHSITASNINDNKIRVIVYSASNEVIDIGSGPILNLQCSSNNEPGSYSLSISEIVLSDAGGSGLSTSASNGNITIVGPEFKLQTTSINFGEIPIGSSPTQSVSISNDGNSDLVLSSYSLDAPFSTNQSFPLTISPGSSTSININVATDSKQVVSKELTFTTNDSDPLRALQKTTIQADIFAVNEIYIGFGEGESNTEITIPVSVSNMEPFSGFQFDITLPNDVTFVENSSTYSSRASDHTIAANVIDGNTLRFVAYSNSNATFSGNSGEVFNFKIIPNLNSGTYSLNISNAIISNVELGDITSDVYNGSFSIAAPYLSTNIQTIDYGRIPITEVQTTQIQLQNSGSAQLVIDEVVYNTDILSFPLELPLNIEVGASISEDLVFTPNVIGLYNEDISIRNNSPDEQQIINVLADVFSPNYLRIVDQDVLRDQTSTVSLNLVNNDLVRAIQFDIEFPDGFTLDSENIIESSLLDDFTMSTSSIGTNEYRFVIYTLSNGTISIGDQTILTLPIYVAESIALGEYNFDITDVVLSSETNQNISSEALLTGTITVIEDTLPPSISVLGDNPMTIEVGSTFVDTGVDVTDDYEFTITTSGTVDTNTVGSYTITYTATDSSGNTSIATRVVNVVDTTTPIITLNGDSSITIEVGSVYTDLGATATDNYDGDITSNIVINSNVDANTVGSYTITYTATDSSGNTSTATRVVNVVDTTAPVITVTGDNPMTIEVGSTFTDPGATATDVGDDDVEITSTGSVDTDSVGSYTITYSATDSSGNTSTATRVVNVVDTTAPVITLNGDNPMTIEVCSTFTDPGATATDVGDGNVEITSTGSVYTDSVGSYTFTYTATDSSGNTSTATRVINVVDTSAPLITIDGDNPMTIEVGSTFSDPGATAIDVGLCGLSADYTTSGTVDTNTVGSYTITYTATDSSGNTSTATRVVNVVDTTPPTITCIDVLSVNLDENGLAEISIDDVLESSFDLSGVASISISSDSLDCSNIGENNILVTVTDNYGNSSECSVTVYVLDQISPEAICADINLTLESGIAIITIEDIDGGSTDQCGIENIELSQYEFTEDHIGENIVIMTVYDFAGNPSTCEALVTVEAGLSVTENLFDNLLVYPNPSSDFIYLNTNFTLDYILYNSIGQIISEGNTNYEIDISNLQSGVYYISFKKDSQTTIRKVIKN